MNAIARPGLLSTAVLLVMIAACGEDTTTDDTSAASAQRGTDVVCEDQVGDVEPLLQFELDEVTSLAADLTETRLSVEDESLVVEWTFAQGAAERLDDGGNHRMEVELEPAEGGNPIVTLDLARSEGGSPVVGVSGITEQGGLTTTEDVDAVIVDERGDTVSMLVPVHMLYGVGKDEWHWSSTSTVGRADPTSGDQHMGKDVCGSTEAGAGSKIVYFPGPDLPEVTLPEEGATLVPMCDRIPSADDIEAIVGVELGEPTRRYATECVYNGVVDSTDNVSFSTFERDELCSGSESTDELGDVPYSLSGGISGVVELCLPTEDLRVTTSIGSIDDDDGPLALELAKLWVELLAS